MSKYSSCNKSGNAKQAFEQQGKVKGHPNQICLDNIIVGEPKTGRKFDQKRANASPLQEELSSSPSESPRKYSSLTEILKATWKPTSRSKGLMDPSPLNQAERKWSQLNQKRLGIAVHKGIADYLQGSNLLCYDHKVRSMIQSVVEEGLFDDIQGKPLVEVPLCWSNPKELIGFNTRLDAHLVLNGKPTLLEFTYRPHRLISIHDLGRDKLAQLAGTLAACACHDLGTQTAILVAIYPFGRPGFFIIDDLDFLRGVWKGNLHPRLRQFYGE